VYTFYDHEFRFRTFLTRYPDLKGEMTDCLMGNLWLDFDPLFQAVAEFAGVPEPLVHGAPLETGQGETASTNVSIDAD
jgi:hypothetical protein